MVSKPCTKVLSVAFAALTCLSASTSDATEPPGTASPAEAAEAAEVAEGGYVGPMTAAIGLATIGGGAGILVAAEDDDVTIGGSVLSAFGIGGLMGGVAIWMMNDLTEEEAEDKVRQGGVALTTVGSGAVSLGGLMTLSSFLDVSDVNASTRTAGIIAASAGAAGMIAGLVMYGLGGPPPDATEKKAWHVDVGPGSAGLRIQF